VTRRLRRPRSGWRNWAGNQTCDPSATAYPGTDAELAAIVKRAAAGGQPVKVVGTGHSFTDIACTDGLQVGLRHYGRVLDVDREAGLVVAQAGVKLSFLNEVLAVRSLGLENLGDIAYQTIAGAISTGTHGTGVGFGGLATQVVGLDLITADGTIVPCGPNQEPEIFQAARVSLGAVGVLSTVTLQCVPAFNLHAVEEPMELGHVLGHLDEYVSGNDHFEFFWLPHTNYVFTKRNNRTDRPVGGRGRFGYFRDRILMENGGFGAMCRAGRMRPTMIPRLNRMVAKLAASRADYVERSYRVFASPRYVHFYEMEYSIPIGRVGAALAQVTEWVNRTGVTVNFPVEVRFVAADDIPLSTATARTSAYIAVHVYRGMPYEQYFRAVEAIMEPLGGRPHWGKLHYQSAATLAGRYPQWEQWQAVRRRLDPRGTFANAYTDRVLGPVG
jgi:L-gulono-1,4-lactone dehydrogenase